MEDLKFNDDFIFGCATASYQIEGAIKEDGKTLSIWDEFAHRKGAIKTGETGDIACDSYHKYKEDVAILRELGFHAYRFSIAWSRIFPDNTGIPNKKGIEYYHNLLKELKNNNIEPYVTLYHWDLPLYLKDWTNRNVAYAFRDYASFCFEEYKDDVKHWITLNEPFCSSFLGHFEGIHAPGHKDLKETYKVVHNLNLAHGLVVKEFRKGRYEGKIGIALNPILPQPASKDENDIKAAKFLKSCQNDVFSSPIFKGSYPKEIEELGIKIDIQDGDLKLINQKIDFLGINYYTENLIKFDENNLFKCKTVPSWQEKTEMGWYITPKTLLRCLRTVHEDCPNVDIYITENGMADNDILREDNTVDDTKRINYFKEHFLYCKEAIKEGIPLKGYFVWSLMDNFEWSFGFSKRFGIVYTDFNNDTKRIIKNSGYFLRDIILGII